MLLKKQHNLLFSILHSIGLPTQNFKNEHTDNTYTVRYIGDEDFFFEIYDCSDGDYAIEMRPGAHTKQANFIISQWDAIQKLFAEWADNLKSELEAPDLWTEAAKTAQLFASTLEPSEDKFTRTELAEVQGQLRLLQLSFTQSALPETAKQRMIELTATAAVKAEGFTKKDWQGWFIGSLISSITALAMNPTQAQEVYRLVKAAFGGLFLH